MQVVLESPSALERQFTITIPTGDVETEFEAKLAETAKRVRIDGFRPGKVPASVVRQRYGQAIRQEIVSDLMEKSLGQALSEHDVKPIGQPKIDDVKFEEGSDFSFKATFEVFPELDPALIDGDEIEQTNCKVGAADIKEMIATLREQRKSWKESARAASKEGDRVTINFEGFIDGEAFEGGKGEDHALVLGSGSMIPGFEDGIVGMKKGDAKDIEVTFPEDYHAENLKGKAATFKIEVTKLERGELPAVDEEFIKAFGVESGDEKDFKAELKEQMERELSLTLKNMNKTKVFDILLEKNGEAPVPEAAIKSEIHALKHQAVERFGGGQQFDPHQLPDELFTEQAERRVRLGILLGATVKKLELQADTDRVRALIDEMAAAYDDP
ncbi:MAG: trigger factor, partial [Gammaproteobacteria bacterium]|nr:trigger factor [Gammaproteobacteria bacterium]